MTLARHIKDLRVALNAADQAVMDESWDDLKEGLVCWALLEDANRQLAGIRAALTKAVAGKMGPKPVTVMGAGTFTRHTKTDRRKWDPDLLRAVLDSVVANEDGEMIEETDLDKVLATWNLGSPRLTELRRRRISADEFCESESAGWAIRVES